MFTPIYFSDRRNTIMPWYNVLLDKTISTTQYLKDNYAGVDFRVVGQEEKGSKISRISEFICDDRVIVHSVVEIDVEKNPEVFLKLIRGRITPIGDILKDNGYYVERKILKHDGDSKEYVMIGDVEIKITEKYYDM